MQIATGLSIFLVCFFLQIDIFYEIFVIQAFLIKTISNRDTTSFMGFLFGTRIKFFEIAF